ncbi:MAG TPA: cation transporter [Zeimonas sp.]
MRRSCCPDHDDGADDRRYRVVLWIALLVNAAMFAVEVAAARVSGSVSLLADSIDFFGDAANYALTLAVLGRVLAARARAAIAKAATMAAFGIFVLGEALWNATGGVTPAASTMGVVGVVALAANVGVAWMLFRHRSGDANRRSIWICSRNDAIGNVAVLLAALGVFGTGDAWPDRVVAAIFGSLALGSAVTVLRQARAELRAGALGA